MTSAHPARGGFVMEAVRFDVEAYRTLKEYRGRLSRQQVRTLVGQIKSGDPNGAMNGLAKILDRQYDERRSAGMRKQ